MSDVTVSVNGQPPVGVTAGTGDTVNVSFAASVQPVAVTVSPSGVQGAAGPAGPQGSPATTIVVGTVTAGSSAAIKATSSNNGNTVTLDFTLPKGDKGDTGATGPQGEPGESVTLSSSTPSALGTAAAGTSSSASRADHVHAMPTAKDLGLAAVATSGSYSDLTGTPAAYSLPTASANTLGGIKVGANLTITDGVLAATGGSNVSLSDALPLPLGTAAAGDDTQAARADHSHPMPTASDVGALDVDATVDGGDYVGVIIAPGDSITIAAQPSSQTVTAGGANEIQSTLPSGVWRSISYVDSKWFVMGNSNTSADYYAVSSDGGVSWTQKYGLPLAGNWSPMQFQNSVYATQYGKNIAASSNLTSWTASTNSSGFGALLGAGGKFIAYFPSGLTSSTDGVSWGSYTSWTGTGSLYLGYGGSTYFASLTTTGIRASTDGITWGTALSTGSGTFVSPQGYGDFLNPVEFNGSIYFGRQVSTPLKYTSGTWSGFSVQSSTYGGQFATDGNVLVYYSYTSASGTGKILSSSNGTTWVERLSPATSSNQNVATLFYAGGRFVLMQRYGSGTSGLGTQYFTSTDGITWTAHTRTYGAANAISNTAVSGSTYASHQDGVFSSITFGGTTASATFSVVATYTSPLTYQWQVSLDAGSTWSNITDATASTLVLTGLTSADSGKKYRCVLSATGTTSVTTNAATLTVN